MYVYFLTTAVASVLMFTGWKLEQGRRKGYVVAAMLVYLLAAVTFSVVAGARDLSVGVDTAGYGISSYNDATNNDFGTFMTELYPSWQPLVKIQVWCIANLAHSTFWHFFSIQFVVSALVVLTTRIALKDRAYLGIVIYGIMFYPLTFNAMRQFMGMGFLLLSIYFVFKKKPIPYLGCVVAGSLFHITCLMGLLIYPIYLIGYWKRGNMPLKCAALAIVTIVVLLFFGAIAQASSSYFGHFSAYLTGSLAESDRHYPEAIANIIVFVVFSGTYWCLQQRDAKKLDVSFGRDPQLLGLAFVVAFGIATYTLTYVSKYLYRIGLFFLFFAILLIPMAQGKLKTKHSRYLFCALWLFTLCCYGYLYYDFTKSHGVVPYILAF